MLARVNGEPVTKTDFERFIKNIEASRGPIPPERRDEVFRAALDQLITYNVMKQEATGRKLAIDDAEIEKRVQQMQGQMPPEASSSKALSDRNTSVTQLRTDARIDMIDRQDDGGRAGDVTGRDRARGEGRSTTRIPTSSSRASSRAPATSW